MSGADEVQARRFAAAKALELGWGGITKVGKLAGMSHTTIRKGIHELQSPDELKPPKRLRKPVGGLKKVEIKDPKVVEDIETIMDENNAVDPMSLLKWTNKSTYKIAEALNCREHKINPDTAGRLLKGRGVSIQANVKTKEGGSAPERDAQFRYINEQAKKFTAQSDPVISVDATEMHGSGKEAATQLEVVRTKCEDCHSSPGKTINGMPVTQMPVTQYSTDISAHKIHGDKLDCTACLTGWAPRCVNCHLDTRTGTKVVIDDFHLGIGADGKIKPFMNMTAICDNAAHTGYGEWFPHTITREAKNCTFCHNRSSGSELLCEDCEGQILGEGGSFIPQEIIE